MKDELGRALGAAGGVIAARDHPRLRWAIRTAREGGGLAPILRGTYAAAESSTTFPVRVAALALADPDAVLLEASAAALLGWRTPQPGHVVRAATRRLQTPVPGFSFLRRTIDAESIIDLGGIRATSPALTAIDLARVEGADALDDALRRGVPLSALWAAFRADPGRPGNRAVRALLVDSRDEPWSAAERTGQRALRERRVRGWRANVRVRRRSGALAILDVAFEALGLAIEIDGYEHHHSVEAFHADRERDLDLRALGWEVVRVSASWLMADPDRFVDTVLDLVRQRALLLGRPSPSALPREAARMGG